MTQQFRRHRRELSEMITEQIDAVGNEVDPGEIESDCVTAYIAAHVPGGEASMLARQLRQSFGAER